MTLTDQMKRPYSFATFPALVCAAQVASGASGEAATICPKSIETKQFTADSVASRHRSSASGAMGIADGFPGGRRLLGPAGAGPLCIAPRTGVNAGQNPRLFDAVPSL